MSRGSSLLGLTSWFDDIRWRNQLSEVVFSLARCVRPAKGIVL